MGSPKTVSIRDLIDTPGIAHAAGVAQPTVRKWRERYTKERVGADAAFPLPVKRLAIGDLFDFKEVSRWLRQPRVVVLAPRSQRKSPRRDPEPHSANG